MTSQEIATISFVDGDAGEQTLAVVRITQKRIALCLSQHNSGDIEVFLEKHECPLLIDALQQAVENANLDC